MTASRRRLTPIDRMEVIAVKKLSLKAKLGGGFGALLLTLALMGFVSYSSLQKLSGLTDEIAKQMTKKQYTLGLLGGLEQQTGATRGFLLSGSDDLLKRRDEGVEQFQDRLGKMQQLLQTEAGKALAARIDSGGRELQQIQQH